MSRWLGLALLALALVGCGGAPLAPPAPAPSPTSTVDQARGEVAALLDGYNRQYEQALAEANPDLLAQYFDPQGPAWLSRKGFILQNAQAAEPYRTHLQGIQLTDFRLENVELAVAATAELWDTWKLVDGNESGRQSGLTVATLYTLRRGPSGWRIYAIDQAQPGQRPGGS